MHPDDSVITKRDCTGILSEVLENTGILAYFGPVFLPCLFL